MSEGINRVFLLGNLGAKPELGLSTNGTAHLCFNLATNESYIDKLGNRQTVTEWHRVRLWGRRAEGLARILDKGAGVIVEGNIRTYSYDKDGQKRYATEIRATDLHLLPSRRSVPQGEPGTAAPAPEEQHQAGLPPRENDDAGREDSDRPPPSSTDRRRALQPDSPAAF